MNTAKPTRISGTVVKKGKKYFQVKLDTTKGDYLHKLDINEISKNLKVGDSFNLLAIPEWTSAYRSMKSYVSHYTPLNEEEGDALEIERWAGFVRERLETQGRVYRKGVEKLKELGAEKELEELSTLYKSVQLKQKLNKFLQWCQAGVILDEELAVLEKYGSEEQIKRAHDARDRVLKKQQEEKEAKALEEKQAAEERAAKAQERRGAGYIDGLAVGETEMSLQPLDGFIIRQNPLRILRVLKTSSRRYDEDGMYSIGEDDYFYSVDVRDVTDRPEGEAARKYLSDREEARSASAKRNEVQSRLTALIQQGTPLPQGTNWKDLCDENARTLWNSGNAHGSGDICFLNDSQAFFVVVHHMDGDDWTANTVDGWGYGWSVPVNDEIRELIQQYQDKTNK